MPARVLRPHLPVAPVRNVSESESPNAREGVKTSISGCPNQTVRASQNHRMPARVLRRSLTVIMAKFGEGKVGQNHRMPARVLRPRVAKRASRPESQNHRMPARVLRPLDPVAATALVVDESESPNAREGVKT